MIELEACMATQSWVYRDYWRGLMLLPTFTTRGAARQEVQDPIAQGGVETHDL
jgi:hypothetical protein